MPEYLNTQLILHYYYYTITQLSKNTMIVAHKVSVA